MSDNTYLFNPGIWNDRSPIVHYRGFPVQVCPTCGRATAHNGPHCPLCDASGFTLMPTHVGDLYSVFRYQEHTMGIRGVPLPVPPPRRVMQGVRPDGDPPTSRVRPAATGPTERLVAVCRSCREEIEPGSRFCCYCAAKQE